MIFPTQFTWGAATSAYQMEGAWDADGKGLSVWDMFTRQPSHTWEGQHGRVACDHYHRYREDAALMSEIGLQAYRLSVSWPRVMPEGTGAANGKGLDFYDRLVDELLARGIKPWVTLFHWDYPYPLFLCGGWLNPDSPKWFAKYVAAVVQRLSDRVSHWITVNDPQCFLGLGHLSGEHAPGLRLDLPEVLLAGHHCLLAHGRAVEVIREKSRQPAQVGWSPSGVIYYPETESPEDVQAARQATLAVYPGNTWNNRWWGDPVVLGHYPEDGIKAYGAAVPRFTQADLKTIRQPIDFYGCNIFPAARIRAGADGNPVLSPLPPGHADTHHLWKVTPEALYWGPRFLAQHYKLPIVITENGMSSCDNVGLDGRVHDHARIEFMTRYLLQLRRAIRDGVDVRGYFVWSAFDNFEWAEGYKHRFGLVHVDYATQKRTLKDSAFWYRDLIASNGGVLDKFTDGGEPPRPYVVQEALRYVDSHRGGPFNIKDIAASLRCHPDFLSRAFKKHTGTELSLHIRKARVDHAKEILADPKALIDEAAEQAGFTDRAHLTKVFRRLTGQTPGQYQRQFRARPAPAPVAQFQNPRSTRNAA